MTNEIAQQSETLVSCANCAACCCRQEAMLFNDIDIPDHMTVTNALREKSMARLEDGWCIALDRKTMLCTIYEKRPWICGEFETGGYECLSARANNL